jgi:hypothetical protein
MTGLPGLLFTSTTGAKTTWTPAARASRPMMAPASRASSGRPVAPIAMFVGSTVAVPALSHPALTGRNVPPSKRPSPGSRSLDTSSGMRAGCASASRCMELTLAATSSGEPSDMMTPPTCSCAIHSRTRTKVGSSAFT